MAYKEVIYPAEKDGFYALLREQVELYTKDSPDLISALANASAVIKLAFSEANWVGFYLVGPPFRASATASASAGRLGSGARRLRSRRSPVLRGTSPATATPTPSLSSRSSPAARSAPSSTWTAPSRHISARRIRGGWKKWGEWWRGSFRDGGTVSYLAIRNSRSGV